jgi:hypothetical protein
MRHQARRLLLQMRQMQRVAVAYCCACGQHLLLTNFEPSVLQRETEGIDVVVLRVFDQMICPECCALLLPVWRAAERVWVDNMLAKFESLGVDGLVQALQMELSGLQEARLKCN